MPPYKTRFTLKNAYDACTEDHWHVAWVWLAYTLFYGLLPSILGVLGAFAGRPSDIRWRDFLIHGEFFIYAATLTAASTRLISKDLPKGDPFVHRQFFNLVSHIVIIPSAALYGIMKYQSLQQNSTTPPNVIYIVVGSFLALVAAIVFSFFVSLFDAQRSDPGGAAAFNDILKEQQHNFEERFDNMENTDGDSK